jgi:hypothetical protein
MNPRYTRPFCLSSHLLDTALAPNFSITITREGEHLFERATN